jgi:hypothetical protein
MLCGLRAHPGHEQAQFFFIRLGGQAFAHDAACEYYFSAGGTGEPLSDDYAKAIATFVKVKLRVENAAEAAANQAQAAADMAQRQADLKAHDANKLKSGDAATVKSGDDNEGGETNE